MAKRKKSEKIDRIDMIGFILSIFVLGFALYFIIFNFIHMKALSKESGVSITSTLAYEEFMNNYKDLKVNVLKLNEQKVSLDMDQKYYLELLQNLTDVTGKFGIFKLQPFVASKSLGLRDLYEIEQSSFKILSGEEFNKTLTLLDQGNASKMGSSKEKLKDVSKLMEFNRDSYMMDVSKYKDLNKYKKASFLGFNSEGMIEQVEPDFLSTMNNMNLAISDYVKLSNVLIEQLGGNE